MHKPPRIPAATSLLLSLLLLQRDSPHACTSFGAGRPTGNCGDLPLLSRQIPLTTRRPKTALSKN